MDARRAAPKAEIDILKFNRRFIHHAIQNRRRIFAEVAIFAEAAAMQSRWRRYGAAAARI